MSIEQAIAANTAALTALTAALIATTNLAPGAAADTGKPAGKPAAGKPAAEKPKGASREEMQAALTEVKERFGAADAKAIVSEVGKSPKMADITDKLIDAVYKAAKAKMADDEAGEGDDGDLL